MSTQAVIIADTSESHAVATYKALARQRADLDITVFDLGLGLDGRRFPDADEVAYGEVSLKDRWRFWDTLLERFGEDPAGLTLFLSDRTYVTERYLEEVRERVDGPRQPFATLSTTFLDAPIPERSPYTAKRVTPAPYGTHSCGHVTLGSFVATTRFFDALDSKIEEIHEERWRLDPTASSGVREQIARRLVREDERLLIARSPNQWPHNERTLGTDADFPGDTTQDDAAVTSEDDE